uniref:Protein takeout n=1 Tax=Glossina austeni TaxID=7395 RepID=A0A1A9UNI1_GLOAU
MGLNFLKFYLALLPIDCYQLINEKSMSTEFCQDRDLLQINMEIIAKELSDLIVTADQETRPENGQTMIMEHVSYPVPSYEPMPIPMPPNSYPYNTCYKQQQNGVKTGFQNVYFNQFYHLPPGCQGNAFHMSGPTYFSALYAAMREMPTSLTNSIPCEKSPPKCEIHYLPRNSFLSGIQSTPLISISAQRNDGNYYNMQKPYRKFSRNHINRNPKFRMEIRDYSKIVVDLSKLGVSIDGKEPNQVLRLFRLLRDLHAAFGEIPPSPVACADSEYVDTGLRALNLIPFDPLHIKSFIIERNPESPVNVEVKLANVDLLGLSNTIITNITGLAANFTGRNFLEGFIPKIDLKGNYSAEGQVLMLPLAGKGRMRIVCHNITFRFGFDLHPLVRSGQTFAQINDIKLQASPELVNFKFDGLFHDDKTMEDDVNKLLNDNWLIIYKEMDGSVTKSISLIIQKLVNGAFSKYPYEDYFLK